MKTTNNANRGFVLITSLIFLVVVTLLAVSAMNSSTLQEKMASNVRERTRAQQIADAALRQGELLLTDSAFDTYQPRGKQVALNGDAGADTLKIWFPGGMLKDGEDGQDQENDATAFLDDEIWDGDTPTGPMPYTLYDDVAAAEYYVEDYDFIPRNLNPDTAAVGDGAVLYRITARAHGKDPSAVAVTQSKFEKYY